MFYFAEWAKALGLLLTLPKEERFFGNSDEAKKKVLRGAFLRNRSRCRTINRWVLPNRSWVLALCGNPCWQANRSLG